MSGDIDFEYDVPVFAGAPDLGTEPAHRDTPRDEELDRETTRMGIETAGELGFDAVWAPDHLMRLDETIRLMKHMWEDDGTGASFEGERYRIKDAYCAPGAVRDPHPPIPVGGNYRNGTRTVGVGVDR